MKHWKYQSGSNNHLAFGLVMSYKWQYCMGKCAGHKRNWTESENHGKKDNEISSISTRWNQKAKHMLGLPIRKQNVGRGAWEIGVMKRGHWLQLWIYHRHMQSCFNMELPRKDGNTQLNYEQREWKLPKQSISKDSIVRFMLTSITKTWGKQVTSLEEGNLQNGTSMIEGTVSCLSWKEVCWAG